MLALGPLLLLLAFLPSVSYMGHWGQLIDPMSETEHEAAEHAGHCHIGVATCSDQPLPPDLSVTPALVRFAEPVMTWLALESDQQRWRDHTVAPPTEPPRAGGTGSETFV